MADSGVEMEETEVQNGANGCLCIRPDFGIFCRSGTSNLPFHGPSETWKFQVSGNIAQWSEL